MQPFTNFDSSAARRLGMAKRGTSLPPTLSQPENPVFNYRYVAEEEPDSPDSEEELMLHSSFRRLTQHWSGSGLSKRSSEGSRGRLSPRAGSLGSFAAGLDHDADYPTVGRGNLLVQRILDAVSSLHWNIPVMVVSFVIVMVALSSAFFMMGSASEVMNVTLTEVPKVVEAATDVNAEGWIGAQRVRSFLGTMLQLLPMTKAQTPENSNSSVAPQNTEAFTERGTRESAETVDTSGDAPITTAAAPDAMPKVSSPTPPTTQELHEQMNSLPAQSSPPNLSMGYSSSVAEQLPHKDVTPIVPSEDELSFSSILPHVTLGASCLIAFLFLRRGEVKPSPKSLQASCTGKKASSQAALSTVGEPPCKQVGSNVTGSPPATEALLHSTVEAFAAAYFECMERYAASTLDWTTQLELAEHTIQWSQTVAEEQLNGFTTLTDRLRELNARPANRETSLDEAAQLQSRVMDLERFSAIQQERIHFLERQLGPVHISGDSADTLSADPDNLRAQLLRAGIEIHELKLLTHLLKSRLRRRGSVTPHHDEIAVMGDKHMKSSPHNLGYVQD